MKNSIEKMTHDSAYDIPITIDDISLSSIGVHMLFDEIGPEISEKTCEFLIKANLLFTQGQVLTFVINTPGGNLGDGWAIIDMMETSRVEIQTVGVGDVASMGCLIFITGTPGRRILSRNSCILTHQFSTILEGKSHELVAARKIHDRIQHQFIKHFLKHSNMTEKQIRDILLRESDTWLEPKEALKYGLCDKIRDPWTRKYTTPIATKTRKRKT